jgi:DNA-binding MarR family transcriptional regulator
MEKEDTNILKDLIIGIRKQLSERLVSPLMPSFVISWLIVNYRLVVAILSSEPLEKKLSFIDTVLFPSSQIVVSHGFLIPLAASLAYILLYPYPAKWVYQYALKRQRELRDARQRAENERILTLEESQRLRTYYFDREIELKKQTQERQEEIEQLRAKITQLEESQKNVEATPVGLRVHRKVLSSKDLTEDLAKVLGALSYAENNGIEQTNEKDLQKVLQNNMTDLKIMLEELERANYIQKGFLGNGTPIYSLLHEGRKSLKEYVANNKQNPPLPV